MKAPRFWQDPPGESPWQRLLDPLGALYHAETQRRLRSARPYHAGIPVICVGNATVGGVGKTPIVRLVTEGLRARGTSAHILTRGYGGSLKGPVQVIENHGANDVGDEPLMLARTLPVWVSADRARGAAAAEIAGAEAIVMDDGLQNPGLAKSLSLLVVSAEAGFGNGSVFPAGPLREKPEAALARSGAVIAVMRSAEERAPRWLRDFAGDTPLFESWFALDESAIPEGPIVGFCGIGSPERFFGALIGAGADVLDTIPFADHHPYTAEELHRLRERARGLGAVLVTTEKDHARLAPEDRDGITPLPGRSILRDEARFWSLIEEHL